MQICDTYSPKYSLHQSQLHSITALHNQSLFVHQAPCGPSMEDNYWRLGAKWILKLRKKINVSRSTLYLAISYLKQLIVSGCILNESNYEKICATLVLMSAKMNEIYPPKMCTLISKCSSPFNKEELTYIEGWVLSSFNFDMSFTEITYSYIANILSSNMDKMDDSEKLLGLAVTEWDIIKEGEEEVALAIVYLIKPALIRDMEWSMDVGKIKYVASKVYNLYIQNKSVRN